MVYQEEAEAGGAIVVLVVILFLILVLVVVIGVVDDPLCSICSHTCCIGGQAVVAYTTLFRSFSSLRFAVGRPQT